MLVVVMIYSEVLLFCLSFKFKTVGSGPTCQSLFSAAKKVTKNAATLRRSLSTTGASRRVFCPAVSERLSPSGIGGTFFVRHLCHVLRSSLPFSEIAVCLFITLCLALILSPSNPHHAQWFFRVKDYSFELRLFILFSALLLSFLSGMRSSIVKAGR